MRIRLALGAVAALGLVACGGQSAPAAQTSEAASSPMTSAESSSSASPPSEAASSPATAPAKGEVPPREFVVGKWGTDGDCGMAIDLRADGTSDGPFGNWSYSDGAISFVDEPDFKVTVTVIDEDTMESTNASSGKNSIMTRCP